MNRLMPRIPCVVLLQLVGVLTANAETPGGLAVPWKLETVHLKSGIALHGLVIESTPQGIRFQNVRRKPGRPTVIFLTTIKTSEILRIDRLEVPERTRLKERINELEENSPQAERERLDVLELRPVAWGPGRTGWQYDSDYFTLRSAAPEEIVRRAVLRLEQVSAAYARYLPPRFQAGRPTTVLLTTNVAEYRQILGEMKQPILNLAFYEPASNRIVCASDLQVLGERLAETRQRHREMRADLEQAKSEYAKLYKGKELAKYYQVISDKQAQLTQSDRKNDEIFDRATQALFATLYHEAFHAYLANFVYPPAAGETPRWLNEGLAQIFETALIEAGEFRVGHADAARLARAKELLAKNQLVSVADLLRSGPKQFLLTHPMNQQLADRHYLTSWCVAFHLTFERRLLGSDAMARYVESVKNGDDPMESFTRLVGRTPTEYQLELRQYIQQLQPDGTVTPLPTRP